MPSALDSWIEDYFQQILALSAEAVACSRDENYQQSEKLLSERLSLLKKLSAEIPSEEESPELFSQYQTFLLALQKSDEEELRVLLDERVKVVAEKIQQKKINKAINAYSLVKQS